MFRHISSIIAAGALALFAARTSVAQTAALSGTVLGDSLGHAVGGAEVSIPSLGLRATTNYLGEFRFSRMAAGQLVVAVRRLGFAPLSDTVTLAAGTQTNRDFQLTAQATQLDSVTVAAKDSRVPVP